MSIQKFTICSVVRNSSAELNKLFDFLEFRLDLGNLESAIINEVKTKIPVFFRNLRKSRGDFFIKIVDKRLQKLIKLV